MLTWKYFSTVAAPAVVVIAVVGAQIIAYNILLFFLLFNKLSELKFFLFLFCYFILLGCLQNCNSIAIKFLSNLIIIAKNSSEWNNFLYKVNKINTLIFILQQQSIAIYY